MTGPETAPAVTVTIASYGNHATFKRVLDGYEAQDCPLGMFELVVVADKNEPDLAAVDAAIGTRPYPIRRLIGEIPGTASNRNVGWRAARAPIVLFTDNDTIPTPNLVSEHVEWQARYPDVATAVLGHVRWAPELRMTPFMEWLDCGVQFDYGAILGDEASWSQFYTANVSVKRAFMEQVGGFDEVNFPYLYDDLAWSVRAHEHGLRLMYNRAAIVHHVRYDAAVEFWQRKVVRQAQAERKFATMYPQFPPYFYERYSHAQTLPKARGRGAFLLRFIPRTLPWLGRKAWESADIYWRQALAPHFLAAWEAADPHDPEATQRELAEFMKHARTEPKP